MKTIITVLALLFPALSYSAESCSTSTTGEVSSGLLEINTDTPAYLKGATITVRLADGKESTVPAEKFKVVARKQQFLVNKTKETNSTTCISEAEAKKNRISLLAGKGSQAGLNRTTNGDTVTVETKVGLLGGAAYQRLLTDKFSVGIQAQTNKSLLLDVGLDF